MQANDTRSRKLGKYRTIATWSSSKGRLGSFGSLSTRYTRDESVSSYRGDRGPHQKFKKVRKGMVKIVKITEPNEFLLKRTRWRREDTKYEVPRWPLSPYGSAVVMGDVLDVYFGSGMLSKVGTIPKFTAEAFSRGSINKAYEKANQPGFAGATQVVELIESIQMIIDLGTKLYRFLLSTWRQYLAKRKKKVVITMADISNWWLLYRYGVNPLIASINDLIVALSKPVKVDQVVTGVTEYEDTIEEQIQGSYGPYGTIRGKRMAIHECAAYTKLYCYYKRDPNPWGFGDFDFALAAWEKVKFSFVVDWFVSVGTWLGAYRPGNTLVQWSCCTVVQNRRCSIPREGLTVTSSYGDNCAVTTTGLSVEEFELKRLTNVHPSIFPAWEWDSWSVKRQIDAFALLWGLLASPIELLAKAKYF